MSQAILLVDHGSRRTEANDQLPKQAELIAAKRTDLVVAYAHMELAEPSIEQALAELAGRSITEITVVPYMLAPGRHATEDIPKITARAMQAYPGIQWRVTEPLGVHDYLAELVLVRSGYSDKL